MSGAELTITVEAVDSGAADSRSVGSLDALQSFDTALYLQQGYQGVEIVVQGSIRVE